MRHDQKSTLPTPALVALFEKYSVPTPLTPTHSPPMTPHPINDVLFDFFAPTTRPQRTLTPETLTTFLLSPDNAPFASPSHTSAPPKSLDPTPLSSASSAPASSLSTLKHDMTHPLSSYFISSSHNTYLVGHQLVGSSTVEGYIRALLAGCRSVEIDVYDGSGSSDLSPPIDLDVTGLGPPALSLDVPEPMVFHGHTLTSKVPLRQICQAIMKYGFIASPYPIIISAENHCSHAGQCQMAKIMIEEFGSALVRYPNDGPDPEDRITQLPSPEELKGRILLKTKNLLLTSGTDVRQEPGVTSSESDFDLNEPSSSASESDNGVGSWLYRRDSDRKHSDGSGDRVRGMLFPPFSPFA
jgi:phosphatidylinositol phospholipase C delta